MKIKIFRSATILTLLILAAFIISCSSSKHVKTSNSSAKKWTYFRILADADDDPIFVKLQDELHIDPKMERYTIVIDVRSKTPGDQYILFGDNTNPLRFGWSQLSEQVRTGLLNWTGNSKENLQ